MAVTDYLSHTVDGEMYKVHNGKQQLSGALCISVDVEMLKNVSLDIFRNYTSVTFVLGRRNTDVTKKC